MIVSRCCKKGLFIEHDYYVCDDCGRSCDTIMWTTTEGDNHDPRNDSQIETVTCYA